MFLNVLSAVLAIIIGFYLSTVFIKYNIIEPNKHFEKYGYKCPRLALYHEKFTDLVNKYLNAFTYFNHELYDTVHTAPCEEEMIFLKAVQNYQNLLDSYKKKKKLQAADSIILQSTFDNLERSYYTLEDIALAATEVKIEKETTTTEIEPTTARQQTKLKATQHPAPTKVSNIILKKTTDNQIVTIFNSLGRECLWEYHPTQSESKEHV